MPNLPPVTFRDNPLAPDIFADQAAGTYLLNGVVRITLESARVNHQTSPGPVTRVVMGRLVMPVASAEAMARAILDLIEKQKSQPSSQVQGTPTIQ